MTETMDALPEGWELTRIGEVCTVNPLRSREDTPEETTPVSFVPMVAVDADAGSIQGAEDRTFSEVRKGYTSFRDDDVIFARITPCMENGKSAVARGLTNGCGSGSTEFHVLRPSEAVLPEYVYHFVRQEGFRREAAEHMTGAVGQARVPAGYMKDASMPLPPLAEQQRIVEAAEALLARVAGVRERLERVPEILRRFRQSVLAAACHGRLTEDWRATHPDTEPASALLDRIATERRARLGKKYRAPAPPAVDETPDLPEGWGLASLDALTYHVTSGSRDWKRYYGRGTGTFIMAQNVRPGLIDLSYRQAVDPPEDNRDRDRSQVESGDLLVTIVGANTGDVCPVEKELPEHYVCQSVALVRPVETLLSPFLNLALNSPLHGRGYFDACNYGAGRPHLSFDQLKQTPVFVPPLEEQAEIVRRADGLLSLADRVEIRVKAAHRHAERTAQAVLAKAFRGELVPTEADLARAEGRDYESGAGLLANLQPQAKPARRRGRPRKSPSGDGPLNIRIISADAPEIRDMFD